ncbi:unnamed protein product [Choristocarpus tenellus]
MAVSKPSLGSVEGNISTGPLPSVGEACLDISGEGDLLPSLPPFASRHRRSESETFIRPPTTRSASSHGLTWWSGGRPEFFGGKPASLQRQASGGILSANGSQGSNIGAEQRRSTGSPGNSRVPSMDRYGLASGRQLSNTRSQEEDGEEDNGHKLMSLSDLIRREDKVPATLYEHGGDADVVNDVRDNSQQIMDDGAVGTPGALQAAEHGDSIRLSKFLLDGGDPATVSRLSHMGWSLLHLAAGCATMGGPLSFGYRSRPEPDCNDGYATCVAELLAAGADPNVTSKLGGYSPLMGAALTSSKECCWLLLRAGAKVEMKADDSRTAFHFSQKARHNFSSYQEPVLSVLQEPPRKVPRSPLRVQATLIDLSSLEPEDGAPTVEVRWRVPSQDSLLPTRCGETERYLIKCWCKSKAREVVRASAAGALEQRRDFCRNQIIDRGIALRKNLSLPQSEAASAIIDGLEPGEFYSFTVSCVAEIDGALRHSPPSCMSKPVFIPSYKEDNQWHLGGMLSRITPKDSGEGSGQQLQVPGSARGIQWQESHQHTAHTPPKGSSAIQSDEPYFSLQGPEGKSERSGHWSHRRESKQDMFTSPPKGSSQQLYGRVRGSPVTNLQPPTIGLRTRAVSSPSSALRYQQSYRVRPGSSTSTMDVARTSTNKQDGVSVVEKDQSCAVS